MWMGLFEVVLQDAIPPKEGCDWFWGLSLEPWGAERSLKQAFSLCLGNNLSEYEWISYKFYYKVPSHKKETGIDFWSCDSSQVRISCNKGTRNNTCFWLLDNNWSKREWIALKMYHIVPSDLFWRFWLEPFRNKGSKKHPLHFWSNSYPVLINYLILSKFKAVSSLNGVSILAQTVQGLTSLVLHVSSCTLQSKAFNHGF